MYIVRKINTKDGLKLTKRLSNHIMDMMNSNKKLNIIMIQELSCKYDFKFNQYEKKY